ncbi:hypothetical protein RHSIM_Rhsim02G0048200 [Rhododendron simsii]|uniref:Uncharacterized protein n=1 Tax=Rhododendron simsii TaxID=118357 RepID=A0A834LRA8_RHOSS|nr:hypothetical protein RHSIM_Rhsim02G0048200 [Rhododendron simsii]
MNGCFPDDCWELIFQKLREDDERDLDSISLLSKRFLSISTRVKHSLNDKANTHHLLPSLLTRFTHIKSIVIGSDINKDIDGLVNQIARSGVLNLQAVRFRLRCSTEPPRDGFRALVLNKKIKNYFKVLDCSGLCSMKDKDLVLIADLFPRIEELRLRTGTDKSNDVVARITDDGVDALASKLKELKIVFKCGLSKSTIPRRKSLPATHQFWHWRSFEGMPCNKATEYHCLEVSDIFERYSDHSLVNLKTVNAWGMQINVKGMAMIGNGCQNLQYLDIGYCHDVTEKGVMELVRNCSRLRDINLIGCKKLSTNLLPQMEFSRLSLWKVELTELV